MQLIRWFLTFILVFAAALLAMLLLALLLVAFGVLKMAGLIRWIRPEPLARAEPHRPQRARPQPAPQPAAARIDRDLPEAPPQTELHRLRSWDAEQNRAVDRWYYKDGTGQWVFVRPPRTA